MNNTGSQVQHTVSLICHPASPTNAVRTLRAHISEATDGALRVAYVIEGELARIRIPEPRVPRFTDNLWQHTCFEMFIRQDGAHGYHEFNFSPSGEWAAYAFERYREAKPASDVTPDPQITLSRGAGSLELNARVPLERLSPGALLTLGLAAVIEDTDGTLSYWALAHPADRPDFHHPDAFTFELREIGDRPRFSRSGSDPH
jgi:hypothetical protein